MPIRLIKLIKNCSKNVPYIIFMSWYKSNNEERSYVRTATLKKNNELQHNGGFFVKIYGLVKLSLISNCMKIAECSNDFALNKPWENNKTPTELVQLDNSFNEPWKLEYPLIKLTDGSFSKIISDKKVVVVLFYSPLCPHCTEIKPIYTNVAKEIKREGSMCTLAAIDCSSNITMAKKFKVTGLPTIKVFKQGKCVGEYEGNRTEDNLKQFIYTFIS